MKAHVQVYYVGGMKTTIRLKFMYTQSDNTKLTMRMIVTTKT